MFKLPLYIIFLVSSLVVPVLSKICQGLKERAKQTPEEWDDVLVGCFETVIEFLKQPDVFVPKK